ncbi:MAG: REJ domain-containing protein [Myxococcota bacterium]|nr:REJ domain-containing protein [Myxococcota bacterium]
MLKTSRIALTTLAIGSLTLLAACKDGEDTGPQYCPPFADAGEDQDAILEDVVTLDASLSGWADPDDPDLSCQGDHALSYTWTFQSVPVGSAVDDGVLSDNNSPTAVSATFQPDIIGTYVVSLSVEDEITGVADQNDLVIITVTSSDGVPVADAGDDVTAQVGTRIELDGSGSEDPEGLELDFSWSISSAPECSGLESGDLYNANTASPSMICDCAGTYLVELVVSDGVQWSPVDSATVTCTDGNQPPVADAGDSGAMEPCTDSTVELDGFGSYDPEGEALTYQWNLLEVPAESTLTEADLSDLSIANPMFTWDVAGDYTFQLQVYDGENWSAPDVVTMTFLDPAVDNTSPVANAGENQSVDLEAACTTSSYVWTCDACEVQEFEVDGSGSFDPDGDDITYQWTTEESDVTIDSPYAFKSTIWVGETEATYGSSTAYNFDIQLETADCTQSDTDTVRLTVNCEGTN